MGMLDYDLTDALEMLITADNQSRIITKVQQ